MVLRVIPDAKFYMPKAISLWNKVIPKAYQVTNAKKGQSRSDLKCPILSGLSRTLTFLQ